MNWILQLPDTDPMVMQFIGELVRWSADNWVTILVITNVLTALQWLAYRTKNVYDDKIITFLFYVISFKWLKDIKGQLGTEKNPYVLKDEVK